SGCKLHSDISDSRPFDHRQSLVTLPYHDKQHSRTQHQEGDGFRYALDQFHNRIEGLGKFIPNSSVCQQECNSVRIHFKCRRFHRRRSSNHPDNFHFLFSPKTRQFNRVKHDASSPEFLVKLRLHKLTRSDQHASSNRMDTGDYWRDFSLGALDRLNRIPVPLGTFFSRSIASSINCLMTVEYFPLLSTHSNIFRCLGSSML